MPAVYVYPCHQGFDLIGFSFIRGMNIYNKVFFYSFKTLLILRAFVNLHALPPVTLFQIITNILTGFIVTFWKCHSVALRDNTYYKQAIL